MKITFKQHIIGATLFCILASTSTVAQSNDPLPSWNTGPTKQSIVNFVSKVTKKGSPDFVPAEERIATFDNDGTLWAEQPLYFQVLFAVDRVKALAPQHPEWKEKEPFKSLLAGDVNAALGDGAAAVVEIMAVAHANMTTDEFEAVIKNWFATAKHPKTGRLYSEMVYQPMVELLTYLRANGFKTYIVSGGGIEFMRAFAEKAYGIPPEQVIGSTGKLKFEMRDGKPALFKLPAIEFVDDKEGKPINIHRIIGRRPIAAFGNSDGDLQMLQWTAAGNGARLAVYIHHTDAEREWAYDRTSHIGKLDQGLDEAIAKGWTVVDMKKDWRVIYPPQASSTVGPSLSGKRWVLTEVNGAAVTSTRAYLEFDLQAKRFSGDGGCNRIAGNFSLSGTTIRFGQVISTRRACLEGEIQKVESELLKALDEVSGFKIEGGLLRLTNGDRTLLTFRV